MGAHFAPWLAEGEGQQQRRQDRSASVSRCCHPHLECPSLGHHVDHLEKVVGPSLALHLLQRFGIGTCG